MSLTPNQAKFASVFARETGLDPHVVGAWMLAEQSGSAAHYYERKGYNNWLNIARTDSGDAGGAHSQIWHDPVAAAHASAQWMKGEGPIAKSYGRPASGIMRILNTRGQGPHSQIQAIAHSGWASSGYEHGTTLSALLGQTGDIPVTGAVMASNRGPGRQEYGGKEESVIDKQGLAEAERHTQAVRNLGSLFTKHTAGDESLRRVLENVPSPAESEYTSKNITTTPTGTFYTPHSEGHYVHPVPGAQVGRTDMGVDASAKPGTPIRAIGDSKVLGIYPNWYKGQPYVELQLLNGPRRGHVYYVAEQIAPHVKAGQYVRGGHAIGHVANNGTGLELGWGAHGGKTKAQATTGYKEGEVTQAGQDFAQFLKGLR